MNSLMFIQSAKNNGQKPVTIRTLEVLIKLFLLKNFRADETNPLWLACNSISLARVDLFKIKLALCFRASVYGNLRIMFPLVCTIEELEKALEIVKEVKRIKD